MTQTYQQQIRKSPMWKQMVPEFGKAKAEELLKEFQVQPGERAMKDGNHAALS